jgi:hypothetical protein
LKPSPVQNPGLKTYWFIVLAAGAKSTPMAATNKSLAQNNKSQTGGGASLPVMTAALCPSCSDLAGSRLARVNPGHHGSDEQMFEPRVSGDALLLLPLKISRSERGPPLCLLIADS